MMKKRMTIVGFGDSITQAREVPEEKNWLNLLAGMLKERFGQTEWKMINAGVGGNTSREGLVRMEQDVLRHQPDVVLIEFGGNDATMEEARHVPLEEYEKNLQVMLGKARGISAKAMLVMFPPVINDLHIWGKHEYYAQWGGVDECIECYRRITRRFAEREKLPLADIDAALREACRKEGREKFILSCGVHLTEAGNRVVAETVLGPLVSLL